jgi:manganese/zinc/iron transport system permease protein
VVVGLQTVGVVLIVATLITPAAAARQWTDRLGAMVLLAAGIGAAAGIAGSLASASVPRLPTGPVIVLVSSSILIVSLLFAPRRGILWGILEDRRAAARIRRENLLKDLYLEGERRRNWESFLGLPLLMGLRGQSPRALFRGAAPLRAAGLVERHDDELRLTPAGRAAASNVVRKHRLWELYLTRRLELPADHVHRDAEAMEHALSDQAVELIDEMLGFPTFDPHGRPIPRRALA